MTLDAAKVKTVIEWILFRCRWILIPFYFKLCWTLLTLMYAFFQGEVSMNVELQTLTDIDLVMLANLCKMVITGSYHSFVSKEHPFKNENNSSGELKAKIVSSIVIICLISSFKDFIEVGTIGWNQICKHLAILLTFILSAWVLEKIEYIHVKSERIEHLENNKHE